MANKVKFYQIWDWKETWSSIFWIVLSILGLILIFNLSRVTEFIQMFKYDTETVGRIIEVRPLNSMRQTPEGNQATVDYYEVVYGYEVDSSSFVKTQIIHSSQKNTLWLDEVMKSKDKRIQIYYKYTDPKLSAIDLRSPQSYLKE